MVINLDRFPRFFDDMREGFEPKSKVIPNPTVTHVCNEFLDNARLTTKARTYEFYRGFIEDFCGYAGGLRLDDLEPAHLDRWLARHPKWKG